MNFTLTITASPELLEAINRIAGAVSFPVPTTELVAISAPAMAEAGAQELLDTYKTAEKTTATRTRKTKEVVKEEETPEAPEEVKDEFKEANTSDEPVTIETVRAAVQEKAAGGKRDEVKALLTKYKVARVTDLVESDYSAFLKEVTAIALEKVKA